MKRVNRAALTRGQLYDNIEYMQDLFRRFSDRPYVIGIDPSLTGSSVGVTKPGSKKFLLLSTPDITRDGGLSRYYRMHVIRKFMRKVVKKFPSTLVVIEGYAYTARMERELMGEIGGLFRLNVFWDMPDFVGPVLVVAPTQLKKYILGGAQKNTRKERVMMKVMQEFEIEPEDNNQADACVLSKIASDLVNFINNYSHMVGSDDKSLKSLAKKPPENFDIKQYRWEVLVSLMTNRCGDNLLDHYMPEHTKIAKTTNQDGDQVGTG